MLTISRESRETSRSARVAAMKGMGTAPHGSGKRQEKTNGNDAL